MPASTITISGTKAGLTSGVENVGPLVISNTTSGGAVTEAVLVSGANTITVPGSTYVGVIIAPPSGNTTTLTLKGVAGDTGVPLHVTNPSLVSFPAGTASFVLAAGGGVTVELNWF